MKKGIIAFLLVFAMLFSATACQKLEESEDYAVQTNAYVTDKDGVEREVEVVTDKAGKTEIFFVDDEGEKVTVAKKDVKVEKKVVTATKTTKKAKVEYVTNKKGEKVTNKNGEKLTKKARETTTNALEQLFGGDTAEKLIDTQATEPTLKTGDEIVNDKDIKEVEVETKKDGTPKDAIADQIGSIIGYSSGGGSSSSSGSSGSDTKSTTKASGSGSGSSGTGVTRLTQESSSTDSGSTYTLEMTVAQTADGVTTSVPIKIARDGDKYYSYVEFPMEDKGTITLEFITDGSKQYIVIPKIKTYASLGEDLQDTFIPTEIMNTDKNGTYVKSGTVTLNGTKYKTEEYKQDDTTITYFSNGGMVKRVEYVSENESMIVEYTKILATADSSLFELPKGYINLEKYINTEGDISGLLD